IRPQPTKPWSHPAQTADPLLLYDHLHALKSTAPEFNVREVSGMIVSYQAVRRKTQQLRWPAGAGRMT
ncbi:MAG: hypothetical protein P8Y03_08795, partial [Anaerolineales bacterium]